MNNPDNTPTRSTDQAHEGQPFADTNLRQAVCGEVIPADKQHGLHDVLKLKLEFMRREIICQKFERLMCWPSIMAVMLASLTIGILLWNVPRGALPNKITSMILSIGK